MLEKSKNKWNLDYSFLEEKGYIGFASRLKLNGVKSAKAFKAFFNSLRKEARETKQSSYFVVKFLKESKLSKKEEKELMLQFYDVLKIMGVGIPFFMIPGATVLVPFLIKLSRKLGLDIIPTSFKKDEDL